MEEIIVGGGLAGINPVYPKRAPLGTDPPPGGMRLFSNPQNTSLSLTIAPSPFIRDQGMSVLAPGPRLA